jgi:hypothetical protein
MERTRTEPTRKAAGRLAELRAWVAVLRDEVERRRSIEPEEPALTLAERRMLLSLCGGD